MGRSECGRSFMGFGRGNTNVDVSDATGNLNQPVVLAVAPSRNDVALTYDGRTATLGDSILRVHFRSRTQASGELPMKSPRVRAGLLLMAALLITVVVLPTPAAAAVAAPSEPPARVCGNQVPGPASAPAGAVVVDPAVDLDVANKTNANPPGTTFWLAPGAHTLGPGEFGQVIPKDGNIYLGAPGAVLDGRGKNLYAFTQRARNVTIRHLMVQGFISSRDEGVVNASSGDDWIIEHNTIQNNKGAGMMIGARQQIRGNCIRDNGQYGINGYKGGDGVIGLVVESNEIVGNNTDDWEAQAPGCGCTGGAKFWAVNGADIRNNWVHGNHGPGLWADTNNNDFLIEGNLIEGNDGEAIFYEISYNLTIRNNTIRNNTWVKGKAFADRGDKFPVAAIYISEAGGYSQVPARYSSIDITGNLLENNWSGVTLWENADRFCNSPANTSSNYCTKLVPNVSQCAQPGIASAPLYSDCRWKTQRVGIHDNSFRHNPTAIGCPPTPGYCGRMAVLSNNGTSPEWSPYKGTVIQDAITFQQTNAWHNNDYTGPWMFTPHDTGRLIDTATWQAAPYSQDKGSRFDSAPPPDPNPGFELDITFEADTNNHVPWFSSTVTRDNGDARTGSHSLLISSAAPQSAGVQLDNGPGFTGVIAGQSYNFSVWYREVTATMPEVRWIIAWRRDDSTLIRSDSVLMPRATTWSQAADRFIAPTGASRLNWYFVWPVNAAGPAFRIDDLLIQ